MNFTRKLVLASSSPRRQYLMRELGYSFKVEKPGVEEDFPHDLPVGQVAKYLASKKAEFFRIRMQDEIIVTADTIVIINNKILNKPQDRAEAIGMLSELAGNTHKVMTGVCIISKEKEDSFEVTTQVTFKKLTRNEIESYIDQYNPFDKAGSYGAQDCLPSGMNPCSEEEINFLTSVHKSHLIENTITPSQGGEGIVMIEKIDGSYFNVMGLPIHQVHAHLVRY
jgi:septum formation protein